MNKRDFVRAAGAAVASGAGVPAAAWATGGAGCSASARADDHDLAAWQQRVGERFEVFGTAAPVQLSLRQVEVRDTSCARTEQFSLVFAQQGPALPDATQVLHQPGAAPCALYLVRAGRGDGGEPLLRADFSRLS